MKFIFGTALAAAIVGALMCSTAARAAAPAAALNKTVRISYLVSGMVIRPGEGERNYATTVSEVVYISSNGRLFARRLSTSAGRRGGKSRQTETGPSDSGRSKFSLNGTALVGQITYPSGARLITADFNADFSSCSAAVREGREGGANIRRRGPTGSLNTVLSTTISSVSCSIEQGNAFAGR